MYLKVLNFLTCRVVSKLHFLFPQGFILVYDVTDRASFDCMDRMKKEIDKSKEKKEVTYTLGHTARYINTFTVGIGHSVSRSPLGVVGAYILFLFY